MNFSLANPISAPAAPAALHIFPTSSPTPAVLQYDVALRDLNSFGVAAQAKYYFPIHSLQDLHTLHALLLQDSALASLPRLVLGGGSNLVLRGDFAGLVVHMRAQGMCVGQVDEQQVVVYAAAGCLWQQLVMWTLQQGYGGLENLALIPGTVGAAPVQNIGAYGVELQQFVACVTVWDWQSGKLLQLTREDCAFAYRDSLFKQALRDKVTILELGLALPQAWQPQLGYAELANYCAQQAWAAPSAQQICAAVMAIRQRKLPDPAKLGNAGSFFKNPLVSAAQRDALLSRYPHLVSHEQADGRFKLAAGWLIDQAGWKGFRCGDAGVYEKQALVLVNHGAASGEEILALAARIAKDVAERFGVQLEAEPVVV